MYILFSKLVNMSIYGGGFILAVLLLRVIFKRAPKRLVILLWALVAVRLLVPVNIGSNLSVFNLFNAFTEKSISEGFVEYSNTPEKPELLVPFIESQVPGHTPNIYIPPFVQIWIVGMAAFLVYAIYSYIKLRRMVAVSIEEEGIYLCDDIASPFILGFINPRIYFPSNMNTEIKPMVLSHERMHIKRLDYIWKPSGFVILAIHWFNPLVWIGFIAFCRDLEYACDEAVIRDMKEDEKTGYSEALFACAAKSSGIAPCPIAFGEIRVKNRIEAVLNYKKPHIAFVIFSAICVMVLGFVFLTDPVKADIRIDETEIPYTDFVGDNSTVSKIVSYMVFPEGYEFDHIELDTSEEPYGLTVVLSGSGDKDFDLFSMDADLAFEHIGNLSSVMFMNKDTGEFISVASRATYLPSETITRQSFDGDGSKDVVDYIYNIDEDKDIYSLQSLQDMVMGFYKGYINGDLKMVQSSMARISSVNPTVFDGNPNNVTFLGIVDAQKVVSGESDIMYIAFEDKNNDEGTKKFLELHITKEPDGWKIFSYEVIVEN